MEWCFINHSVLFILINIIKELEMAANGISSLPTKEARQKAKLDLAADDRARVGNPRDTYDIEQLPTQYSDNDIVDNANTGGLVQGRPWQ
jgi:hypothetical protein